MKRPAAAAASASTSARKRPAASSTHARKRPAASPEVPPEVPEVKIPEKEVKTPESKKKIQEEGEEEEKAEHDPVVEDVPSKSSVTSKPEDPDVLKKPSTKLVLPEDTKTDQDETNPANKTRGEIVQTIQKKNGWSLIQIRTPKGRLYWKFAHKDGEYFFSSKQAKQHGYED